MQLQIRKWFRGALFVLVLLALIIYSIDKTMRCKESGLTRDDALKIANSKLETQFKNNPLLYRFKLVSDLFESDKSWVFAYQTADCVTYVVVDKCGVADIGGLSGGCISR